MEARLKEGDRQRLELWMMFTGATKVDLLKNVIHYGLNVMEDELGIKHGKPDIEKMEAFLLAYRSNNIRRGKYTRCEYCHKPVAFSKYYMQKLNIETNG